MIWLHGCNHVQLCEALEVFGGHVLRMLDSQSAIGLAVSFDELRIEIENGRDALVTNGMCADLQSRRVSLHVTIPHERNRMHFIREQTAVVALIQERLVKVCCS